MGYYPTYIEELVEIANSRYPYAVESGFVQKAQVEELLLRSGYEATSEQGILIYNQTLQTGAESISGNLAIQTELVEDATTHELSVVADNLAEKSATATTPKIKKGALAVEVSPLMMVGGALYGANLGWESYKEYPEFWTDLSNDVFFNNEKDLLPGIQASELVKGGTLLLRVLEDGGIRGYCEKKRLEEILQKAYDKGAFISHTQYTPTTTQTETKIIIPNGCSFDMVMGGISAPMPNEETYSFNKSSFDSRVASRGFNCFVANYYISLWDGGGRVQVDVDCYKLDQERQTEFTVSDGVISVGSGAFSGLQTSHYLLDYNYYDGQQRSWGWTDYATLGNVIHRTTSPYRFSTLNVEISNPVEGLIHDDSLATVTDRNNVFNNFPTWLENGFSVPRYNEDTKENEQVDYLPFPIFDILNEHAKSPNADAKKGDLPQNPTDPLKLPQFLIDILAPSIPLGNGTPSENNDGNTPPLVPPTNNNSSKLFTVYNPSGANLDSLGAYLWSDSIATLIKELFSNNRMDAIISLHQVYCTPSTTTAHNIILGNLDSGVSSPVVNNQYVNIDCGRVYVAEKYGDARDYLNVDCQVYLPFIGFRNVDAHDVINCYLNIKYTVDVYTGSCLAQLIVTKGNITQTLYTFEGNCSVQIPLTGSDRARIIGAIASTVATGIATGGVGAVGMAVGQVASGGAQSSIQRTSGFSGNCGAMAIKKPYIVMTRLKSADAVDYNKIVGNPTNKTVYLRNCNGFTRVKEIHLDALKCTDEEKRLIYNALKQGIVL